MKKIITAGVTALMLGSVFAAPIAEAQSRGDRERYVQRYCDRNPSARDCRDFRNNRSSWNDRRYRDFYNRNGRGDNAAAAIFGLAAGAALGAAAAGNGRPAAPAEYDGYDDHETRCARAYRSYDPRTDTYVVNSDGDRARCRL